jgi:cytochrome c oxidase subunit III
MTAPVAGIGEAPRRGDAIDVSELPSYGFSHRSLMWWGTAGVIAIEGTVFVLAAVAYFYLWSQSSHWPMSAVPPDLLWGTVNTGVLLASVVPNQWAKHAAQKHELHAVRRYILIALAFAVAFLLIRIFEFRSLNVGWDWNAYGSIVWMLMGLHTAHLLTDAYDTSVLAALMHTDRIEGKRFVDVAENALYWDFVVISWVPIYAIVYWAPRWLS